MTAKYVRLRQLGALAGAEEKPLLTVTDELNEQLRYVLRKINLTLSVIGFEVIVNFTAPCLWSMMMRAPLSMRISEALLADRLGLNEEWIERWEEGGEIREESHMPDRLPAFIHKNFKKGEIEDIGREVKRLVEAGCRRQVVYFCLAQLSPEAEWLRAGGWPVHFGY